MHHTHCSPALTSPPRCNLYIFHFVKEHCLKSTRLSTTRKKHPPFRALLNPEPSCLKKPRSLWWSWSGSNRRPSACKADALPAELQPHGVEHVLGACVVGLVGFEPTTPALSRRCSNQLSYRPSRDHRRLFLEALLFI